MRGGGGEANKASLLLLLICDRGGEGERLYLRSGGILTGGCGIPCAFDVSVPGFIEQFIIHPIVRRAVRHNTKSHISITHTNKTYVGHDVLSRCRFIRVK